jgi:cytochrome o ubiquinol oxidase subunit 2
MLVASCQQTGILDPQGPVASAERLLLINSTAIMLVVVVPVILMTLGFAWWYRSSNARARRSEELAYEGRIDFVVWSIPALVVILLVSVRELYESFESLSVGSRKALKPLTLL